MLQRLTVVLVVTATLSVAGVLGGCSFDSPKLRSAPPVSTGPLPTTTVAPGPEQPSTAPVTLPGGATVSTTAPPVTTLPGCHTTETPAPAAITKVATATDALQQVPVYDTATAPTPCERLPNPDPELKHPPVLVVLQAQGDRLQVMLPTRPNNSVGWVTARDVAVTTTNFQVKVSLGGHRVQVFKGTEKVVDTPAGVGTGDTPTPPGVYFIVGLLKPTNRGYGPYAYALSAHSDKLETFAGGDGRIGLHGTDDPSSIGKNVSHGCIRIPNDVISNMAEHIGLPLGTPVIVTA